MTGGEGSTVILVATDLIFVTKITSTAAALCCPMSVVRDGESLATALDAGVSTCLVDLDAASPDPLAAIESAAKHQPRPTVIAFGPHVDTERLEAARSRGADSVLPRSVFVNRLTDLLAAAMAGSPQEPG